jgi:hypothetical protein
MIRRVIVVVFAAVLAIAPIASAGEVEGKVQSLDSSERAFTLDNGTKIWVAEGMSMDKLKEGAQVKASYEERDGKNVATSIDISD